MSVRCADSLTLDSSSSPVSEPTLFLQPKRKLLLGSQSPRELRDIRVQLAHFAFLAR